MFGLLVNVSIGALMVASAMFLSTWRVSDYPAKHRLGVAQGSSGQLCG